MQYEFLGFRDIYVEKIERLYCKLTFAEVIRIQPELYIYHIREISSEQHYCKPTVKDESISAQIRIRIDRCNRQHVMGITV